MPEIWLDLLRKRCDEIGTAACAKELGYSRPSVSMARAGKYPAAVGKLRAAVIKAYSRCDCPFLGAEINALECRSHRCRALPQSNSEALRFWAACRGCPVGQRLAEAEAAAGGRR